MADLSGDRCSRPKPLLCSYQNREGAPETQYGVANVAAVRAASCDRIASAARRRHQELGPRADTGQVRKVIASGNTFSEALARCQFLIGKSGPHYPSANVYDSRATQRLIADKAYDADRHLTPGQRHRSRHPGPSRPCRRLSAPPRRMPAPKPH